MKAVKCPGCNQTIMLSSEKVGLENKCRVCATVFAVDRSGAVSILDERSGTNDLLENGFTSRAGGKHTAVLVLSIGALVLFVSDAYIIL